MAIAHEAKHLAGFTEVGWSTPDPVRVQLQPWGSVTARLVDGDGQPLADFAVQPKIMLKDRVRNNRIDHFVPRVFTDSAGRLRVDGLIPGRSYRLVFEDDEGSETAQGVDVEPLKPGEPGIWAPSKLSCLDLEISKVLERCPRRSRRANLVHRDGPPFIHGPAHQQPGQSGVPGLGQGDRRGQRLFGPDRGEEIEESLPGIILRAGVNGLAGTLAVAEGQRAGTEIESASLTQDPQSRTGEALVGGGDPALQQRSPEAVGPFELNGVVIGHIASGVLLGEQPAGPIRRPSPADHRAASGARPRYAPPARP